MTDSLPQIDFHSQILSQYPQILEMLIANTYGKIYMVGGAITKTILNCLKCPDNIQDFDYWNLYSLGKFPFRDLDFIAEEIRSDFRIPDGWEMEVNIFGGTKLYRKSPFENSAIAVDIWKLRKHEPCRRNGLEYNIENVLRLAPLSVQSIAVDLEEGKLFGEVGIDSIRTRTVAVNHRAEAQNYCRVYKTTLQKFIEKKAKEYDFTPIL